MWKLLLAGTALLALGVSVQAQTVPLPAKAPIAGTTTTTSVCSFTAGCNLPYIGGGLSESGGSFDVISTGLSGLAENNLNLFGEAGWDYWNPTTNIYVGGEAMFEYGIEANGTLPGGGTSELWGTGVWGRLGYGIAQAYGIAAPTSGTPSLSGIVASTVPYVDLGYFARPWGGGFLTGAGVMGWIAPNVSVHIDYLYVDYNNASINPNVSEQSEQMVLGGFDYHFKL